MTSRIVNGMEVMMTQEDVDARAIEVASRKAAKDAQAQKDAAVATYNAALAQLESAYPQKERDTWPQQVTEAMAYLVSDQAATPLIDAMLTSKPNTTKAQLVSKIMTNYTAYSTLVGAALGEMQEAVKSIES